MADCRVIDYTNKCIVVTGDTKPIKNELKDLGGKYNPNLATGPGWVFKVEERDKVEAFIKGITKGKAATATTTATTSSSSSCSKESKQMLAVTENTDTSQIPFLVQYSDKSIAVFGDSRAVKDKFKEINGRFNKFLKYEGSSRAGWVFPDKNKFKVNHSWRRLNLCVVQLAQQ